MDKKKYSGRKTNTDVMIENLMKKSNPNDDGSLININETDGSFSSINTHHYGIEQDVDDL